MAGATPTPEVAPAIDAATVVLLRDGAVGMEVLLLRRSDTAGFVPGAHVFPGGAVDPADAVGEELVRGIDDAAASAQVGVGSGGRRFWVAAVRECVEEAGVAPGVLAPAQVEHGRRTAPMGGPGPASRTQQSRAVDLSPWRQGLHDGELPLASALEATGSVLDGNALRCVARWVTPVWSPRRFDTRFFLASMPEGAEVCPDGSETVEHSWYTPADALEAARAGYITMIMPTVRTLVCLEAFHSSRDALENMRFGDPAEALLPEMLLHDDGRRLAVLRSDPERNGGVYDGDTAEVVTDVSTGGFRS